MVVWEGGRCLEALLSMIVGPGRAAGPLLSSGALLGRTGGRGEGSRRPTGVVGLVYPLVCRHHPVVGQ